MPWCNAEKVRQSSMMKGRCYDSLRLWQPLALLRTCAAYSYLSVTDFQSCCSLSRTSPLTLTAKMRSADAAVHSHIGNTHTHTEDSWHLPPESQACPYMVRVINTHDMFYHEPSSKHSRPLGSCRRHKAEGWSSCASAIATFSLLMQLAATKLPTCLVRISSLEAL